MNRIVLPLHSADGFGVLGDQRLESGAVGGVCRSGRQGDGRENAAEHEMA